MKLIRPTFVALDSALLGNWYGDRLASDPARRDPCQRFEAYLADSGSVIVLTAHHLIELLGVKRELAEARLKFIASMPLIGWPHPFGTSGLPGGVTDILSHEIEAAMLHDTAIGVRDHVRSHLFELGPGVGSVALLRQHLDFFQRLAAREAEEHRQNVALTRSVPAQGVDVTLRELKERHFKGPAAQASAYAAMRRDLTEEVEARKDKKLEAPAAEVADWFMDHVERRAPSASQNIIETLCAHLAAMDVDIDELGPDVKMADLVDLGTFRQRLRVVSENLPHLPWARIRERATQDRLPSALVDKGLRRFAQDQPERRGSEIPDRHIAPIACYADLTFVDRRTQSDLMTVRRKMPHLAPLLRATKKNSGWDAVIDGIKTVCDEGA